MNIADAQLEKESLLQQRDNLLPPKTTDGVGTKLRQRQSKRLMELSKDRHFSIKKRSDFRKGGKAMREMSNDPGWKNLHESMRGGEPSNSKLSRLARIENVTRKRVGKMNIGAPGYEKRIKNQLTANNRQRELLSPKELDKLKSLRNAK